MCLLNLVQSSLYQKLKTIVKQECIPVGCVPAARRPYAGVCFPGRGSPWSGGVCLVLGGSPWSGGFLPGRGVCLVWGGLPGPGGVCLVLGGSGIPACTEADTLPPVDRHTCKNITLATTSLRLVKILLVSMTCNFLNKFNVNIYSSYAIVL